MEASHQPVRQPSSMQDVHMRKLWCAVGNTRSSFNLLKDPGGTTETRAAPGAMGVLSDRCLDPLGRTTSRSASNKGPGLWEHPRLTRNARDNYKRLVFRSPRPLDPVDVKT